MQNLAEMCSLERARNLPSEVLGAALPGLRLARDTQKPPALHEPGAGEAGPIAGTGCRNLRCFGNLPVGPPEPGGINLLLLHKTLFTKLDVASGGKGRVFKGPISIFTKQAKKGNWS